ncbi:hypothetical protein JW826_02750 [Candidatus Woesearchaeota archaeon]|nr:hypothetical protein [Candidatus Woesearchaeota archaeon]
MIVVPDREFMERMFKAFKQYQYTSMPTKNIAPLVEELFADRESDDVVAAGMNVWFRSKREPTGDFVSYDGFNLCASVEGHPDPTGKYITPDTLRRHLREIVFAGYDVNALRVLRCPQETGPKHLRNSIYTIFTLHAHENQR